MVASRVGGKRPHAPKSPVAAIAPGEEALDDLSSWQNDEADLVGEPRGDEEDAWVRPHEVDLTSLVFRAAAQIEAGAAEDAAATIAAGAAEDAAATIAEWKHVHVVPAGRQTPPNQSRAK
jgi:hypothetical protein